MHVIWRALDWLTVHTYLKSPRKDFLKGHIVHNKYLFAHSVCDYVSERLI